MGGEEEAVRWLVVQGYEVVERNPRTDVGEIDLIARDGDTPCFGEMNARLSSRHDGALATVGRAKQRCLVRTARVWLALNPWPGAAA